MSNNAASFLLIYPLYLIVDFRAGNSAEATVVQRVEDGCRGVAVFTEELLAERYRDASKQPAELVKLKSPDDMANLIDDFVKCLRATHVAIDPNFNNLKQTVWIRLKDFLG